MAQLRLPFPQTQSKTTSTVAHWIGILSIITVGALLRLWALDHWSLWTDELYTWELVQDLQLLRTGVPDDQHPPIYHLLLSQWVQWGSSESWLRLPSAIAGTLALPFMYGLGRILSTRRYALITLTLFATSPVLVWYGREARMYGLAVLFWVGSMFFFTRVVAQGKRFAVIGLALFNILAILTTYASFGLIMVEIALLYPLWLWRGEDNRNRLVAWGIAQALTIAGFAAWVPFMLKQTGRDAYLFHWPVPGLGTVATSLAETLLLGVAIGTIIIIVFWSSFNAIWHSTLRQRRTRKIVHSLILPIFFAFIVMYMLGAIPRGLTIRRQLLVFWPIAVLVGAWAISQVRIKGIDLVVALAGTLLCLLIFSSNGFEDWRNVSRYLDYHVTTSDTVLFEPLWFTQMYEYYPEDAPPHVESWEDLAGTVEAKDTVWVVVNEHPTSGGLSDDATDYLLENATLLGRKRFASHLVVLEYQMR